MNGNKSPLHSVFAEEINNVPAAFAQQFLLTPADDHYIVLKGKMSEVTHPTVFTPLFWLLGKFGMLVPSRGKNIPTTVTLKALYDEDGNVFHTYNRKLDFEHPYEFNTTFLFDGKYQQPAETLGPFGILYMVWKTEYLPPTHFRFETMATAIKIGNLKIWLPKWIWKLLGTTVFEQSTNSMNENTTQISLQISTPFSKNFFSYKGEFEVIKVQK